MVLGIVGGLGPESTLDYYRLVVELYRESVDDGTYPQVIINSINLKRVVDGITGGDLDDVTECLVEAVETLGRGGADLGLISANTPHVVFDRVEPRSPIPLISIVEAACDAAKAMNVSRVGIFGTRFTMNGRFYSDVFDRAGIALVRPDSPDQDWIHDKYMDELVEGVFEGQTRAGFLRILDQLREQEGIAAVLLAGTELPLLIRQEEHNGVAILDTARIHVEVAIDTMIKGMRK